MKKRNLNKIKIQKTTFERAAISFGPSPPVIFTIWHDGAGESTPIILNLLIVS